MRFDYMSEERPAADPPETMVLGGGGPSWATTPIIQDPAGEDLGLERPAPGPRRRP